MNTLIPQHLAPEKMDVAVPFASNALLSIPWSSRSYQSMRQIKYTCAVSDSLWPQGHFKVQYCQPKPSFRAAANQAGAEQPDIESPRWSRCTMPVVFWPYWWALSPRHVPMQRFCYLDMAHWPLPMSLSCTGSFFVVRETSFVIRGISFVIRGISFVIWGIYFVIRGISSCSGNQLSHGLQSKSQGCRGIGYSIRYRVYPIFYTGLSQVAQPRRVLYGDGAVDIRHVRRRAPAAAGPAR